MTNKNNAGDPEKTEPKQDTRFKPGQSGNPAGRPKGARSRLGETFIQALAEDFDLHGPETIAKVRSKDPTAYIKVISNILPREVLVQAFSHTRIDLASMEQAEGFLAAYRFAPDKIGAIPLIDAEPIHAQEGAVVTESWRAEDD
jgi:hypothetical protein